MDIVESFNIPSKYFGKLGLTIGNFEGYHLGHRKIIKKLVDESRKRGLYTSVLTFKNHPLEVIRGLHPKRLWARCDKIKTFQSIGIDLFIYIDFDREFASLTPEDFLFALKKEINPKIICLGESFRFGRNNSGDLDVIYDFGRKNDITLVPVRDYSVDGEKVSSTRIRTMIKDGKIKWANKFLGRNYRIYIEHINGIYGLFIKDMAIPEKGSFHGELFDPVLKEYYDTLIEIDGDRINIAGGAGGQKIPEIDFVVFKFDDL